MMTKKQLADFCRKYAGQSRRTIWSTLSGYKIEFSDGTTYMYTMHDIGIDRRENTVYINGIEVRRYITKNVGFGDWIEEGAI